jgi:diguanylate cyclase (GGDEF)-like protein
MCVTGAFVRSALGACFRLTEYKTSRVVLDGMTDADLAHAENARLEVLLRRALPAGISACAVMAVVGLATGQRWMLLICGPGILGFMLAYLLMRRRAVQMGAFVIIMTATLLVTASSLIGGGLRDPSVLAYPVVIIFGGMTLSRRLFLASLGIITVSIVCVALNMVLGVVPQIEANSSAWQVLLVAAVILSATAYAVWLLAQSTREGLDTAHREIQRRRAIELELKELSTHDDLTGVFNRRFFDAEMTRLEKTRRQPVSIIVADIDGLKMVNDRCGHAEGDRLVIDAARILATAVRAEDVLARVGGDEFSILLPDTDRDTALAMLSRIERQIEVHSLTCDVAVSLSLGAATSSDGNLAQTWARADSLMYACKAQRREHSGAPSEPETQGATAFDGEPAF